MQVVPVLPCMNPKLSAAHTIQTCTDPVYFPAVLQRTYQASPLHRTDTSDSEYDPDDDLDVNSSESDDGFHDKTPNPAQPGSQPKQHQAMRASAKQHSISHYRRGHGAAALQHMASTTAEDGQPGISPVLEHTTEDGDDNGGVSAEIAAAARPSTYDDDGAAWDYTGYDANADDDDDQLLSQQDGDADGMDAAADEYLGLDGLGGELVGWLANDGGAAAATQTPGDLPGGYQQQHQHDVHKASTSQPQQPRHRKKAVKQQAAKPTAANVAASAVDALETAGDADVDADVDADMAELEVLRDNQKLLDMLAVYEQEQQVCVYGMDQSAFGWQ